MPRAEPADWNDLVRALPDKRRLDTTPLFADPGKFRRALDELARPFVGTGVTKVAALDALGFGLGGGIAYILQAGLIHVRKGGKAMWHAETSSFRDYSGTQKSFELVTDAVQPGDLVLVVDDWTETGTQLKAAFGLIEKAGGRVAGAALLQIDDGVREDPFFARHRMHQLFTYAGR